MNNATEIRRQGPSSRQFRLPVNQKFAYLGINHSQLGLHRKSVDQVTLRKDQRTVNANERKGKIRASRRREEMAGKVAFVIMVVFSLLAFAGYETFAYGHGTMNVVLGLATPIVTMIVGLIVMLVTVRKMTK